MIYTVTLMDFTAAPPDVIHAAEARFRAALDKALADQVAPTLRVFQSVREWSANELAKNEVKLTGDWVAAYAKAREAGFAAWAMPMRPTSTCG